MASSVDVGPGMTLAAPTRSRNCWSLSQRRRLTTSSRISAMCAAGPTRHRRRRGTRPASPELRVARAVGGAELGVARVHGRCASGGAQGLHDVLDGLGLVARQAEPKERLAVAALQGVDLVRAQ